MLTKRLARFFINCKCWIIFSTAEPLSCNVCELAKFVSVLTADEYIFVIYLFHFILIPCSHDSVISRPYFIEPRTTPTRKLIPRLNFVHKLFFLSIVFFLLILELFGVT